ncbi:DNA recombination protein RmuC [Albibacterium indicum]|uniref:DNA recombination protein RmuC n=1 Tax=Albibacterium indicum TaxID=2292082 RepID=UPI001FEB3BEB|nr:DNA recombination protein RmuC [Pedobacter indicus]
MDYSIYLFLAALFISVTYVGLSMKFKIRVDRLTREKDETLTRLTRSEYEITSLQREKDTIISFLKQENNMLKNELEAERATSIQAQKKLEKTQSYFDAQSEKMAEQRKEIELIKNQMNKDFELIAHRIITENSERFSESSEKNLSQIINPFKENLRKFEDKVNQVYNEESKDRNSLKGAVDLLIEQSKQIQDEANNLSKALKGNNKKQGNWGEIILERVLERSGLLKNQEYRLQESFVNNHGQRLQPDAIIDLPDEKNLVIDSKVSLIAYERWINTEVEEEKSLFAKQHLQSVKNHIIELSAKNYCDLYQINSPDFVLLFIPIESSFSMSISMDNDLFNFAWERRVVLVSPSTLLATLRTIAGLWKQERQNRNVIAIAREAGLLYDKFVGFIDDMEKIEKQINLLSKTHEDARKKLDSGRGNIISKIEKLRKLGAKTTKTLDSSLLDSD